MSKTLVRLGLLGLGNVGQALARLCSNDRAALGIGSAQIEVVVALVRERWRKRRVALPVHAIITDELDTFLASKPDVVVEVLGGVEPAHTFVRRILSAGLPVVTANKSLIAACGEYLLEVAREHDTELRYEASVLAGVPFLHSLATRYQASRITGLCGVLNGTSSYTLSLMRAGQLSVQQAIQKAQEAGFAEPEPENDVSGIDALEKLTILARHFGLGRLRRAEVEVSGIEKVQAEHMDRATHLGGRIQPIAFARRCGNTVEAFVGPAFLDKANLLAQLQYEQNGIQLQGRLIDRLFFAGPGAGPDITAATLVDDVLEVVAGPRYGARHAYALQEPVPELRCVAPRTAWFVCLSFSGSVPLTEDVSRSFREGGVALCRIDRSNDTAHTCAMCAMTEPCERSQLDGVVVRLSHYKCQAVCFRALTGKEWR